MNAGTRKLIEKLKPEQSRIILALDDYLECKANLDAPLKDCSRPIIEGRQFLEVTRKYVEAVNATLKDGKLKSSIAYVRNEARQTIEKSIPYHYQRLSSEFPEILNGHAPKAN